MEDTQQNQLSPSRLSSASEVIDALGGTNAVAELLDIGASSVSNYRKLGFPARSHFILAKICTERGLDVADAVFGGYQVKPRPAAYRPAAKQDSAGLAQLQNDGFQHLSLPILQPAAPFIDRMGPEMQRRLFTFTDPGGEQLCLRPDLTIPTAMAHIASGKKDAARYCYQGTAFRYQPRGSGQPEEFTQLGLEIIGGTGGIGDDGEVLRQVLSAIVDAGLPLGECKLVLSNAEHFTNKIDSYDFSEEFARFLKQRLLRGEAISDLAKLRENLINNAPAKNIVPPSDATMIAGRSGAEIRQRLDQTRRNANLAKSDLETFDRFVKDVTVASEENAYSHGSPSDVEVGLFTAATGLGVREENVFLRPAPSKKMAYYTGMFFEVTVKNSDRPIAAGGRYDDLLHSLGASAPLPAVGGAIALERLNRAVEMSR